jgi:hypothetical protein
MPRPIIVARHWNSYLCTVVLRESEHSYPIYHLKITRIGEGEVKDWCLEAEYEASPQVRPCYVPLWLMPMVLQELWMVQGKGSKATVPLGTFGQPLRDSVDHESLQSCVGIQVSAGWLGSYNIRDIGVVMRPRDHHWNFGAYYQAATSEIHNFTLTARERDFRNQYRNTISPEELTSMIMGAASRIRNTLPEYWQQSV